MCYYNGQKVTRDEYIQLKSLEKQIQAHQQLRSVVNGFDYGNAIILKAIPDRIDFELVEAHWEFVPPTVKSMEELKQIRLGIDPRSGEKKKAIPWLNAKAENLLFNEEGKVSMFRQAAMKGRCLVLSSGFYDSQLVEKERHPHFINVIGRPYFFMAGVRQMWMDSVTGEEMDTFAIVTTEANALMQKIHNTKMRMPTVLTENLAYEWLFGKLSFERIIQIASYRYPSEQMHAKPIHKDFLTREDPTEELAAFKQADLFSPMTFEIEIDTAKGRYKMQVERTYAGESIEKFRVTYRDRSLLLESNQPFLLATRSIKRIQWHLREGEIRNPNVEEATMTLFRIQKAIEAYMKSSKQPE